MPYKKEFGFTWGYKDDKAAWEKIATHLKQLGATGLTCQSNNDKMMQVILWANTQEDMINLSFELGFAIKEYIVNHQEEKEGFFANMTLMLDAFGGIKKG